MRIDHPTKAQRRSVNRRKLLPPHRVIAAVLTAIVIVGVPVWACNIPVFRYALERWQPDESEILIYVEGPLSASHQEMVDSLQNQPEAKLTVSVVDLSDESASPEKEVWANLKLDQENTLPHVVLRTKVGRGRMVNHWHGAIEKFESLALLQSPIRKKIGQRLLAGDSVVWLLVRSKDDDRNKQLAKLVRGTFQTLRTKVKLPEGIGLPGSELYADLPLVVKFSLLEMDPTDPKEAYLTSLLTGIREDEFREGQPLLVPIFGRGRALEVIPAIDVTETLVEELAVFLSGACSCQVKEQNPGFDLLIKVDWENELFGGQENRPPDRSAEEGQRLAPQLLSIPPGRK